MVCLNMDGNHNLKLGKVPEVLQRRPNPSTDVHDEQPCLYDTSVIWKLALQAQLWIQAC